MKTIRKLPAIFYCSASGPIGKPRVDYVRESIWEVRSQIGNRIARVFFAVAHSQMVLLHGFVKKTQQTPSSELELAVKRLKEWTHEQNQ
jgi:phage-related protein